MKNFKKKILIQSQVGSIDKFADRNKIKNIIENLDENLTNEKINK